MHLLKLMATLAISLSALAQAEDVIYKNDGSILRGTLIEQDFKNGQYKIQLSGGSVFVIKKDDIQKIAKEDAYAPQVSTEQELEKIATESRDRLNINNAETPVTAQNLNTQSITPPIVKPINSTFYIGTLSHAVSVKYDAYVATGYNYGYGYDYELQEVERTAYYNGMKLGFQHSHSKHIASHYAVNMGSISRIETVSKDDYILEKLSGSELIKEDYLGLSASIIASTNLQKGWQFFTGLGLIHDEYSNDFADYTFTSIGLELGMGYNWQKVHLGLQYQGVLAGDYDSEITVSNLNLQLGINI